MTAFMSTLQAVQGTAPDPPCGEFDIEAVAEDGTRRKVPLASATRTPFADMTRSAGSRPGRGSGTCRAAGGRLPMAGTWAMNRGWNASSDVAGLGSEGDRDRLAAVSPVVDGPRGQDPVARAGLLRRARRRPGPGSRLPARGPPSCPGPGRVRGNSPGMRPGRVGIPAGRRPGPGCHGEPAVAGRVPAPAVRHTDAGRGAAGRIRCSCPAGGRGGGCG